MTESNPLVEATDRLTQEVRNLGHRLRVSEEALRRQDALIVAQTKAADRQSRWIKVTGAMVALLLVGFVWLWNVADAANDATNATKANAVTNCKNANQSREGALRLWLGIIDAPRPTGSPSRTEEQQQQIADLRVFVENLYQQRDCTDLSRKYPLPELPDSLKPRSE